MRGLPLLFLLAVLALAACAPVPRSGPAAQSVAQTPEAVELVRVYKAARTLEVWSAGRLLRRIGGIQLGWQPVGPKQFEGDGRTPEGRYVIDWRNPRSAFYLSLHISYPDAHDVAFARARGRSAGGMIMIHGQPNGTTGRMHGDWTDGCIAVSNAEMDWLWQVVPDGSMVEINP
ncbi:L,D-transpeptidase family protein [Novosphingobium sp. M1R2S20]|uniref:Murein L,D-transpeptidase family protein n=1 Tax=Novosphingobium rhizovicinum TaxID=3228928 RepID=A0ABV3RDI0_9SPHN